MNRNKQNVVLYLVLLIRSVTAADQSSIDLAKSVSSAIVSVQSEGMDSGSGVVVTRGGLIITSSTLLARNSSAVKIQFADGQNFSAEVVAIDSRTESALLRVKSPVNRVLPFLTLADSSLVKVGSHAITAGNPLDALSTDHQIAFGSGSITGMSDVRSADAASRYCGCALETDAAINVGSEGGALVNDAGEMIGMTCLCVDRARMRGCAVPSNCIRAAYEKYLPAHAPGTDAAVSLRTTQTKEPPSPSAAKKKLLLVSFNRTPTIVPGTRLQIVTKSASASLPCICNCIVSATCRCDDNAVQIDARLNESDAGASVLNSHGELVGIISHMNLTTQIRAQNAGVAFFTPVDKLPEVSSADEPLIDLVAASSRAFVFIGDGSGVVISNDGLVLTNYHVAGSQNTWTVRLAGEQRTRQCEVVGKDVTRDLCLLKIRDIDHVPFLKLGNSSELKAGEQVLALGDPFKLGEKNGDPAASMGIISALHRNQGRYVDAIQTDCAINPGNSGGPLVNMAGELVGLNGQIISRYGKNNTGVAFAIPVDQIKEALSALKHEPDSENGNPVVPSIEAPRNTVPARCGCSNGACGK